MQDFYNCFWDPAVGAPSGKSVDALLAQSGRVNAEMLSRNEAHMSRLSALRSSRPELPVVTFSHFAPRADLLHYERLHFKELVDVAVSDGLDAQVCLHIFSCVRARDFTHVLCNRACLRTFMYVKTAHLSGGLTLLSHHDVAVRRFVRQNRLCISLATHTFHAIESSMVSVTCSSLSGIRGRNGYAAETWARCACGHLHDGADHLIIIAH